MSDGAYTVQTVSTAELPPAERAGFWSAHVSGSHCRLDCRFPRGGDFLGGATRQRGGPYQLIDFWSERVGYSRTAGQARQEPDEDYRLLVPVDGGLTLRQDGAEVRLTSGTGGLFTPAEPFELVQDAPARALVLTIPAQEVNGRLGRRTPLSARFDMTTGLARVVDGMIRSAYEERDRLSARQFEVVCDRVAELMCMVVDADDRPGAPGHLAEVEAMVRRFVRANAADPDLTGATVAHRLGWSLRQVQLALQHAGTTPRELIREERLRLVRDRLRSPRHRHRPITELAHASGFSSASALSTAFRHRYGVSPRELRAAAFGEPSGRPRPGRA
ncbi:helix-turn-helix domain-containing protein [Actinomadura sp. 9N407]|uniref:AraC family transcriptional regulator n=1 Tax=Actinomadura sp. 9N407 TaxID=3375154 RepID=UPI0037934176